MTGQAQPCVDCWCSKGLQQVEQHPAGTAHMLLQHTSCTSTRFTHRLKQGPVGGGPDLDPHIMLNHKGVAGCRKAPAEQPACNLAAVQSPQAAPAASR